MKFPLFGPPQKNRTIVDGEKCDICEHGTKKEGRTLRLKLLSIVLASRHLFSADHPVYIMPSGVFI